MRAIEELSVHFERWGADGEACYLAQLAVEELGTNILKHAYDDPDEHQIGLRAVWEEPWIRIEIEDDGHEFDPCQRAEPNPELSSEERTLGHPQGSTADRTPFVRRRAGRHLQLRPEVGFATLWPSGWIAERARGLR